jgi:hypothetical protein
MRKLLVLAAVAAAALSTPAFADTTACVRQNDIRNWTALNDKSVVLENYRHQKVLLKLIGTCSNLQFNESLVIRSPGATGLSCVSVGDTITSRGLGGNFGSMNGRCAVVSVTPFTGSMQRPDHDHDADSNHHSSY